MQKIKLNDDIYSDFIIYTASEWKKKYIKIATYSTKLLKLI